MASNINRVLVILSVASLLALFHQVEAKHAVSGSAPVDAKTKMNQFIVSTMRIASHKAEEFLKNIDEHAKNPATSGITRECLQECKDVYEAAMDDMKNTIDDVKSENYYKANVDLSAILTNVDTCRDCYREMIGKEPNANNFDAWVMGVTSDCLQKLETVTS